MQAFGLHDLLYKLLQMLFQNSSALVCPHLSWPCDGTLSNAKVLHTSDLGPSPWKCPQSHTLESERHISSHVCSNVLHLLVVHPSKRPVIGVMTDLECVPEAEKQKHWEPDSCSCGNCLWNPCTNSWCSCYSGVITAAPGANINGAVGFTPAHTRPFVQRPVSWQTTEPQVRSVQYISNVHQPPSSFFK